jgi:hypothetical protein
MQSINSSSLGKELASYLSKASFIIGAKSLAMLLGTASHVLLDQISSKKLTRRSETIVRDHVRDKS